MKNLLLKSPLFLFATIALLTLSCKPKKATASTSVQTQTAAATNEKPKTTGKVSHEFAATGCGTVVIVQNLSGEPMILIPSPKLGAFDVEGQEISFHYRPLKMKNPAGCMKGFPAELTDITLK
jgi:hypothetical protein